MYQHIKQPFEPVYDKNSRILILGSFPSVKSRENNFYYGNIQNRFWRVLSGVLETELPLTTEDKKKMLLENHIAIWDVIEECDIEGSSDASIRNPVPCDIRRVLDGSDIKHIFTNGKKSESLYNRFLKKVTGIESIGLPSTSPANAAWKTDDLMEKWKMIKDYIR